MCPIGCEQNVDIVFAVDASSSMGNVNFQKELDIVTDMIESLNVGSQVRVGLLTYASDVNVVFDLNEYDSKQAVLNAMAVYYSGGNTNTAGAIQTADNQMFQTSNGDRDNIKNLLVLLSDGVSNDRQATLEAARQARTRSSTR